ncbi:MAG: HAMP domain-containing histidine kinase [Caulobacterales bacterium]|nr:HAMP domain-containing histidine kinase [Caulobacterales bacterium]MCA0373572.1 GHKL domain-containing protein [Pseudomonadota bacterium]
MLFDIMLPKDQLVPTTDADSIASIANFKLLTLFRTLSIVGYLIIVSIAYFVADIMMPVRVIYGEIAIFALFNVHSFIMGRGKSKLSDLHIFVWLLVDIAFLFMILTQTGGPSNPFAGLLIVPLMLGSLMLPRRLAWGVFAFNILVYLVLELFESPMIVHNMRHTSFFDMHIQGMMFAYFLSSLLLVFFVNRISETLRTKEALLRDANKKAFEEQELIRLGLLTTGAAHELGTPMATLSVILSDWQEFGPPKKKIERDIEIESMLIQLNLCKTRISDILASSGAMRAESAKACDISEFINQTADEWQTMNAFVPQLVREIEIAPINCFCDKNLGQSITNVLNNAYEASRGNNQSIVILRASETETEFRIEIEDFGNGFEQDKINKIGTPFNTSKSKNGHGLGLFLVANTLKYLDGKIVVQNKPKASGSIVKLTIPKSAIEV